MSEKKIIEFSWKQMDKIHRKISEQIKKDDFSVDVIVGILRCGMVSAVHIAYILNVDTVRSLEIRTTNDDEILTNKKVKPDINKDVNRENIEENNILLVDTVMASGTTIRLGNKLIKEKKPNQVKTAVIVDWENSPYENKDIIRPKPEYIGAKVNKWPDFPWEN